MSGTIPRVNVLFCDCFQKADTNSIGVGEGLISNPKCNKACENGSLKNEGFSRNTGHSGFMY